MKKINMGWGHPAYMKEYWRGASLGTFIGFDHGIDYQLNSGNPNLIEAIKELHESEGNAVVEGRHIVIANGATQVIRAMMTVASPQIVFAQKPYYSRFPTTAAKEHRFFHSDVSQLPTNESVLEIITTPNNPDGFRKVPLATPETPTSKYNQLYDLCYNWTQYGDIFKADFDNMVFSLSKATGHAGSRIGWGIFKSKEIADKVQLFVEMDTCGVSADAQIKTLSMILDQLKRPKTKRCFHFGRYELKYRWAKLKQVSGNYADIFELKNRLGMFALVYVKDGVAADYFEKEFGVEGVKGAAFGMSDNYLRLNIGCETEDFDEFIKRLEEK